MPAAGSRPCQDLLPKSLVGLLELLLSLGLRVSDEGSGFRVSVWLGLDRRVLCSSVPVKGYRDMYRYIGYFVLVRVSWRGVIVHIFQKKNYKM